MAKGTERAETYAVCAAIIEEAKKLNRVGHMIVFTSAEDKTALSMARQINDAYTTDEKGPRKAATPCGKRFSAI